MSGFHVNIKPRRSKWERFLETHPGYEVWRNMVRNCGLKGSGRGPMAKYYQDRGIAVCEEWRTYLKFSEWLLAQGWRQGENLAICRVDKAKDFSPENCIVCRKEEVHNYYGNVVRVGGRTVRDILGAHDYTAEENLAVKRAVQRYARLGWDIEDAVRVTPIPASESGSCRLSRRDTGFRRRHREQKPLYDAWRHVRSTIRRLGLEDSWPDYRRFESWALGEGWKPGMAVTRRDKDGDYRPGNCKVITRNEHVREMNRRRTELRRRGERP